MSNALWTTTDLLVFALTCLIAGALVGANLRDWWPLIRQWWASRAERKKRRATRRRLKHMWRLDEEGADTAITIHERWHEGRCVFCGRQPLAGGQRCEHQVDYVESTGLTTWETSDLDDVLEWVFERFIPEGYRG